MDERDPGERLDEQAAIGRLADELLPGLVAKLGTTGLGELEVRDGDWRVRLRRPLDGAAPVATAADRAMHRRPLHGGPRGVKLMPVGPGLPGEGDLAAPDGGSPERTAADAGAGRHRSIATSPAVGIFQGRAGVASGSRVSVGDPIGAIDVLGVAHEVVSPVDGILGQALVGVGEPVEYGQEIAWIEQPDQVAPSGRDRPGPGDPAGGA